MATTLYRNNVAGTLAANVGPSDTILLLGPGQGAKFPTPSAGDWFYVTLVHLTNAQVEIVRCTARTADSLTVQRGRDSTTAIAFVTGSVVEMRLTAVMLTEIDYRPLRGVANGLASLDASTLIPIAQIPTTIARQADLTSGLATKQNLLGFTPVRQGGGAGQGTNTIYIGWSTPLLRLKVQVDSTDLGNVVFEGQLAGYMPLSHRGAANGVASLDAASLVPVTQIPALGYLPLAGGTLTGNLNISGDCAATGVVRSNAGTFWFINGGTRRLVHDGTKFLFTGGDAHATDFVSTSDERMKQNIVDRAIDPDLPFKLQLRNWNWKETGLPGRGVIAQELLNIAPDFVHGRGEDMMGVDKAGLALEAVVALSTHFKNLEARFEAAAMGNAPEVPRPGSAGRGRSS